MLVLVLGMLIALADQVVKVLIRFRFYPGESRPVIPGFFDIVHSENRGVGVHRHYRRV